MSEVPLRRRSMPERLRYWADYVLSNEDVKSAAKPLAVSVGLEMLAEAMERQEVILQNFCRMWEAAALEEANAWPGIGDLRPTHRAGDAAYAAVKRHLEET